MGAGWSEADRDAVVARLRATIEELADGEFLVVGEPARPVDTPRRRFGRRATPPPTRYVQFRLADEWLYAECVGAQGFGGDWPATAEQVAAIRAAGWLAPGDADPTGTQPGYPNFWRTVPAAGAGELAAMGAAALEALGVDAATVEVQRGQA
ncbi:TY-Chap domain-containing protein [Nocardioides aquiterrae]|uniref:TY-Chap domain-containing protein n=1 Tax=Nocardioides aquiterrae TaxID=203799 RepID=UPI0031CF3BC8